MNPPAASAGGRHPAILTTDSGPGSYGCTFNVDTQAFTGAYGTASEIGWKGNYQGVVTCLGGTFYVQDGINKNFGFGIYTGTPTTWRDAAGYLPAQVTTFRRSGATVSITEFADRVVIIRSNVQPRCVQNPTGRAIVANPQASSGLVPLNAAPNAVNSHASVVHDYVVAVDRFGNDYSWPSTQALAAAGSFDHHYAHMRSFWNQELKGIAGISVPDRALDDAYRSGFIYTQIARSGNALNTGVNGYGSEFSHDVVGILVNLFTQGDFSDARALLLEARSVVGSQGQYVDGTWTYPWPWAIYLMKTGDLSFIKRNFSSEGVMGSHNRVSRTPPMPLPQIGPDPRGSWSRPWTSTSKGIGPPTTTKPCWPGGLPLPCQQNRRHFRGRMGDATIRQSPVSHEPDARCNH